MNNEAIINIKEYLENIAKIRGQKHDPNWLWPEELLLKYGQAFPIDAATLTGPRMAMKECYSNAYHMVLMDSGLTYCEGYVQTLMPIAHAWVVDKDNLVIDPTLRVRAKDEWNPKAYFGIKFKREYLAKQLLKQKVYGLLDGMVNPEIYTGKVKPQEFLYEK